jgi:transposase
MARRPKRSPEREQAVLNALRVGNTRRASAAAAGISHALFYTWLEDETFLDAVTKAEADAELRFLGQVAKHAATSPQAAQWWLERRRPDEYGKRERIEMSGPDGGPIDHRDVTGLDDYERHALAEAIRDHLASGRRHDSAEGSPTSAESG